MTARLSYIALRVADLERSIAFYRDLLGMALIGSGTDGHGSGTAVLGYPQTGPAAPACLELHALPSDAPRAYALDPHDLYWKIGITLPDIDHARAELTSHDVDVTPARQFRDIGYLCHLEDPDGFRIELLQHTFQGSAKTQPPDPATALGGGATLAHVTLRCLDAGAAIAFYTERLGMRLVSRQPVLDHGFTLYFLGFLHEEAPVPDIEAVANREWLWQRRTTLVELQELHGPDRPAMLFTQPPDTIGFGGIHITNPDCRPALFDGPDSIQVEITA